MALFTLLKITHTRYMVGKKHVKPGTPGAVKVCVESQQWYAYRRDGKRQKVRLFTDKAASLTELAKLNTALERGEAGMTDPRRGHFERAAAGHLDEFQPAMRANGKSYKDRKEAIPRAFAGKLGPLSDLTATAVDRYLADVSGSAGNKKKHLSAISVWVEWLLRKDRIAANPLARVDVPTGGKKTKERRALTVPLIQKLLDATRQQPLAAFVERYGPDVRDEVRRKMALRGRERAMVYKTAVDTGLRLGEIASLRPCHLELVVLLIVHFLTAGERLDIPRLRCQDVMPPGRRVVVGPLHPAGLDNGNVSDRWSSAGIGLAAAFTSKKR